MKVKQYRDPETGLMYEMRDGKKVYVRSYDANADKPSARMDTKPKAKGV